MNRHCLAFAFALGLAACSRSDVELPDPEAFEPPAPPRHEAPDDPAKDPEIPCEPEDEVCDGLDNDCDGQVDEGLPSEPCPGGGVRYCVGGVYSECPRACDVCQPGSRRVCFLTYCTIWGDQRCESDGRAWGRCREEEPPEPCKSDDNEWGGAADSPDTERCCIDEGYCCEDYWDLDGDGDTEEMVGRCDGVSCG